jgi:hypothetical protein
MKIAKALKTKNTIVKDLQKLKGLLLTQNVRNQGQEFEYDNKKVLADTLAKVNELIAIKASVAAANAPVYADIFRMAELKSLVEHLKTIPVREGTEKSAAYGGAVVETTWRSTLGRVAIDELVSGIEKEIQTIQDKLDTYNFTTEV